MFVAILKRVVLFPNHWSQTAGSPKTKKLSVWEGFRQRKFSCRRKKCHFKLAVHLNVTRRRFLKNFGETFKKIWSNLRLRLGKKSIRYGTLHLIEGDACAQLRSVTEIASKSPFDMWTEILSGMIFVPAQERSAFVWIWPQPQQPNCF